MNKEFRKEELLKHLDIICDRAVSADEQLQDVASKAYAQLRKIVEEYFDKPDVVTCPQCGRRWDISVPDRIFFADSEQAEPQGVTRYDITMLLREMPIYDIPARTEHVVKRLKELGIEVEE